IYVPLLYRGNLRAMPDAPSAHFAPTDRGGVPVVTAPQESPRRLPNVSLMLFRPLRPAPVGTAPTGQPPSESHISAPVAPIWSYTTVAPAFTQRDVMTYVSSIDQQISQPPRNLLSARVDRRLPSLSPFTEMQRRAEADEFAPEASTLAFVRSIGRALG